MANKSVFASTIGRLLPRANAWNHEKAPAYGLVPRAALAQLAATGTFNRTFYAEPREQLDLVLKLALQVDSAFIAKTAIYAREKGYMKDMPAALLAVLAWLLTFYLTRTSSLAALIATPLTLPLLAWQEPAALLPMSVLTLLIVWRHRGNLRDLFAGRERHF